MFLVIAQYGTRADSKATARYVFTCLTRIDI